MKGCTGCEDEPSEEEVHMGWRGNLTRFVPRSWSQGKVNRYVMESHCKGVYGLYVKQRSVFTRHLMSSYQPRGGFLKQLVVSPDTLNP